jgi:hypothetical protein
MSKIDDGGPAFPQHVAPAYQQEPAIWGMSFRDWIAGQMFAQCMGRAEGLGSLHDSTIQNICGEAARLCYMAADEMIHARKKD